jgi:ubiquinone/menaquinone biosynthesis C-methylase UbiE
MLIQAKKKLKEYPFWIILADMLNLPFPGSSFDKVVSVTALEFVEDAKGAIGELFRITKRGGCVVVATLNRLRQRRDIRYLKRQFSDLLRNYSPLPL